MGDIKGRGSPLGGISAQACAGSICAARGGVGGGEEPFERHGHEVGVAIEAIAVGEGQLEGFGDEVQIVGAIVAERREIVPGEDAERLRDHRPLTPGAAGEDLVLPVAGADRGLVPDAEAGEIVAGQQAPLGGAVPGHRLG